jgi:hypothetical protein
MAGPQTQSFVAYRSKCRSPVSRRVPRRAESLESSKDGDPESLDAATRIEVSFRQGNQRKESQSDNMYPVARRKSAQICTVRHVPVKNRRDCLGRSFMVRAVCQGSGPLPVYPLAKRWGLSDAGNVVKILLGVRKRSREFAASRNFG